MAIARKKVIPRSGRGRTAKTTEKPKKKAAKKAAKKTAKKVTQKVRKKVTPITSDRRKSTAKKTTTRRPTAKTVAAIRSSAAKKGWETRKANERREVELHEKRVLAGKRAYAKRLLNKFQDERRLDKVVLDTRKEALPILEDRLKKQQNAFKRQMAAKRKEAREKYAKMTRKELLAQMHPDDAEHAESLSTPDLRAELYGRDVSRSIEVLKGGHAYSQTLLKATISKVALSPMGTKASIHEMTQEGFEAMVKRLGWVPIKTKMQELREELQAWEFTGIQQEMFQQIAIRENMTTHDLYRVLNGYL